MASAGSERILICADSLATTADYPDLLSRAVRVTDGMTCTVADTSYAVEFKTFAQATGDLLTGVALLVIDGSRGPIEALHVCRRLRARLTEPFVPIFFVAGPNGGSAGKSALEQGADTWLPRPFPPELLAAQLNVLLKIRDLSDRLADRGAELHQMNRRLQQLHQQREQERILADRLGASLFPTGFPLAPGAGFGIRSKNGHMGRLGGDFYEAFRLDEHHVGLYLADVMAGGVSGTLLSLYLQRTLVTKEITDGKYRLLPPSEALQRLNRVLVEQSFAAQPFGRMIYAVLNHRSGLVQITRGGHPSPWLIPKDGVIAKIPLEGSLLGLTDIEFPMCEQTLRPGDKLLLSSDRVASGPDTTGPSEADVACLLGRHRDLPVQAFVDAVFRDLGSLKTLPEDLTLLAVELQPPADTAPRPAS